MNYWDTSTLAKLYVSEPDSAQFAAHLRATGPVSTSELARWELFRVLVRKESEGVISPGAAEVIFTKFLSDVGLGTVALIPMGPSVEERFRQVVLRLQRFSPPVATRTLDGIHLATADLHKAAEVVGTDLNLRKCAVALGLQVYP
jgi:uncharacterized protein with PIN domain